MRCMVVGGLVSALALLSACGGGSGGSSSPAPPPDPPPGGSVGLDQRPVNASCVAPSRGGGELEVVLERVFAGLSFTQPLAMLQAPGDGSRWFVLEKQGRVRVFENRAGVASAADFIAPLAVNESSEGGLLGMAFHPGFATNGEVFLSFTERSPMVSTVARYRSQDGGTTLAPGTRENVLQVNQPFENHNGGQIAFGPDGYLYIGFGDGGSGGDPGGRAQDTTDLLGDFLRLDVDGGVPYAIPPDNPFAGGPHCGPNSNDSAGHCPEIFAWGFRNPWRFSFDRATGSLWVGDVGQNAWEEVNVVQRGGNYGWNCREGANPYGSPAPACSALAAPPIDPVHQYGRTQGVSITGGYVYRGTAVPALAGAYVFGDFGSGRIWRLTENGNGGYTADELVDTNLQIASFAEDVDGELYVVDLGGTLHRIVAGAGAPSGTPVATQLSATGCVDPQDPSEPASGLIPYAGAAPFWSDDAAKERWLALPNATAIAVGADGDFTLPAGSVLMKHFRLDDALVETRLLMRHPDGGWAGYSYEWNAAGTDATLVQGGKTVAIGGQQWVFPSGAQCLVCHTAAAGFTLGLEIAQLNHAMTYPSTGRTANQLRTLDHIVLFSAPLGDPAARARLADPFDAAAPLGERARAYLHANCAGCHRPGGAGGSLDLRFTTALGGTGACDAPPEGGDLGLGAAARIVAPGRPDDSVLLARVMRRDANGMPPLASTVVDTAGAELLREWITGLTGCL